MKTDLYLGDCLEVMQELEDGSVDAVITDPPYKGLTGGYEHVSQSGVAERINKSNSIGDLWGANLDWAKDAWRVTRYGIIVFCSYHNIVEVAQAFPEAKKIGLLTWYKRNAPPTGKNVPRHTTEFIWLFSKKPGLKWDSFKNTMIDIPKLATGCFASERILQPDNDKALHPTQKPIDLMNVLLGTKPDSVLDPFMGTGTTGVACVQTERNFIGIEIKPKYYEIAEKRIAEAKLQIRMEI